MFCINCGKELPNDAKFCLNCGKELPNDAKFCLNCGTALSDLRVTTGEKKEESTPSDKILCPRCGREVNKDSSICPNCKYIIFKTEAFDEGKKSEPIKSNSTALNPASPWAKFSYGKTVSSQKPAQPNKCICGAVYPTGTFYCPKCKRDVANVQGSIADKSGQDYMNFFALFGFIGSLASILIMRIPSSAWVFLGFGFMVLSFVFAIIGVYQTSHGNGRGRGFGIAAIWIDSVFFVVVFIVLLSIL